MAVTLSCKSCILISVFTSNKTNSLALVAICHVGVPQVQTNHIQRRVYARKKGLFYALLLPLGAKMEGIKAKGFSVYLRLLQIRGRTGINHLQEEKRVDFCSES